MTPRELQPGDTLRMDNDNGRKVRRTVVRVEPAKRTHVERFGCDRRALIVTMRAVVVHDSGAFNSPDEELPADFTVWRGGKQIHPEARR